MSPHGSSKLATPSARPRLPSKRGLLRGGLLALVCLVGGTGCQDDPAQVPSGGSATLGASPQSRRADPAGGPGTESLERSSVVIYGASWCGPCHEPDSYLSRKGVAHVMKDIERTPGAAEELEAKLERAHARGGSIPVLDIGGQLLVGYSPPAIDRAVERLRGR